VPPFRRSWSPSASRNESFDILPKLPLPLSLSVMPHQIPSMRLAAIIPLLAIGCTTLHLGARNSCRPPDENAAWLLERAEYWIAPVDSVDALMADSLHVPRANPSQIRWVREGPLCAAAAHAYRATSGRPSGVSGRVYLIDAGAVYVVLDPEYSYEPGPVQLYSIAIFDRHWRLLAHVAG